MHWLLRYSPWLAAPVGAALSLAFAPFNLWPLAILCPAFLFLTWQGASPKRAALNGFLFTAGLFVAGTYWLYHSIFVIGNAPLALTLFLIFVVAAVMAAYTALCGYAQARWFPKDGALRFVVALPAAWAFIEWLRGWLFSGFPWLAIGYSSIDTPIAAYAPFIGVYGASWILAVLAGALAATVVTFSVRPVTAMDGGNGRNAGAIFTNPVEGLSREKSGTLRQAQGERGRPLMVSITAFVLLWLLAFALWHRDWTTPIDKPISVAIVQGSVAQEMKWTQEQHDATLKLYHDLTVPHWGAQLIVWPESALPDWAESLTSYLSSLWQEANVHRSDMLIGQIHQDDKGNAYNGVLALSDKLQWYNKRHLVPYGEYFPVPQFVREWMRSMSLPYSDFTAGDEDQQALRAAGQNLGVSICYEDAYGSSQLAVLKSATVLVNVTNDAWFGDTTARHQHLQIARMRALEAGRPLIRAANDGISGFIDSQGALISQLPSFQSAVLTGVVQPRTGLTVYASLGNWPVVILCTLGMLVALVIGRKRTRD